jgi:hypothetical protein
MTGEFYQLSRSWYGKDYIAYVQEKHPTFADQISFKILGCKGKCVLAFYDFFDPGKLSPRLEIDGDGWEHLAKHPELFAELAQHPDIQPDEFCQFLKERGFRDVTPEQSPYKKEEVTP